MKGKKAQEEMLGFALIMIIVAVILLVFLGFSLKSPQKEMVESYEVESFIQAFLQYTSDCEKTYQSNYLSVQKLILECDKGETCLDGDACEVLNSTLKEIVEASWKWKTGEDRPVKAYELTINSDTEEILSFKEGNITRNYKGSLQILPNSIEILFTAYY